MMTPCLMEFIKKKHKREKRAKKIKGRIGRGEREEKWRERYKRDGHIGLGVK